MSARETSPAPVLDRAARFRLARALLRALETDESVAGREYSAELDELWALAGEVLPWVVGKPVEMPYLTGLDVGDRVIYERPAPYQHVIEYVEAAAQRFSWDDPRGPYEAAEANPPDERILGYLAQVRAFCQRRGLGADPLPRMIVHAQVRGVAAGDRTAGERALEELAEDEGAASAGELEQQAAWAARALLEPASWDAADAPGATEARRATVQSAIARFRQATGAAFPLPERDAD